MQIFIYCKVTLHVSGVTAPIIRSTKTVTATSGTGHNTGTATSLQSGLIFIHLPMKMEPIECSETSAIRTQTPGN